MRVKTLAATILSAIAGFIVLAAPSAHAATYSTSSYGARLLQLVNQARSSNGLHTLTLASGTTTVAAGWTQHLAQQAALSHNPNLASQLESHGSPDWTIYGENVGQGAPTNPDQLFNAYMQSPEHRANILEGRYRYVGVAVVFAGGYAWNTFDFVDQYGGSTTTSSTTTKTTTHTTTTTTTKPTTPTRHVSLPVQRPAATPHKTVTVKHAVVHHAATAPRVEAVRSEQPAPATASTLAQPVSLHAPAVTTGSDLGKSAIRLAAALAIVLMVGAMLTAARQRRFAPAFG